MPIMHSEADVSGPISLILHTRFELCSQSQLETRVLTASFTI